MTAVDTTAPASRDTAAAPVVAPLRVGPLRVWPPVVLAPMAGVTNPPFRTLCRRYGAGLYVSEMITARALVEGNERTLAMARFGPRTSGRGLQLYGVGPDYVGEAVRRLRRRGRRRPHRHELRLPGAQGDRQGRRRGHPAQAARCCARIVRAAVAAAGDVPVTIKFRMGIDDEHLTYLDSGRIGEEEGCAAVGLHARTAAQLYDGQADWDAIARAQAGGDRDPRARQRRHLGGGGRAAHDARTPAATASSSAAAASAGPGCSATSPTCSPDARPSRPPLGVVTETIRDHARRLADLYGERGAVRDIRKHTGWYLRGYAVGPDVRRNLNQVGSFDELDRRLDDLDPTLELPPESVGLPRGHQHGPKPVTLPHGFYDTPDDGRLLGRGADAITSGG